MQNFLNSLSHLVSLLSEHLRYKAFTSFSRLMVFFWVRKRNTRCVHFGLLFLLWKSLRWYMRIRSVDILTFLFLKEQTSECSLNQNPQVNEKAKCAVWWFPYSCPLLLTGISCLSCWRCFYREVSIKVNHPWAFFSPQGISCSQLGINLAGTPQLTWTPCFWIVSWCLLSC